MSELEKLNIQLEIENKLITYAIGAVTNSVKAALEDIRFAKGECVCGKPVAEEGDEYCAVCFDKWISQKMDERKNPDER
jgi:hypothetical protein